MREDINQDGTVDSFGLSILLANWNTSHADADINQDGNVDVFDLSMLLAGWGETSLGAPAGLTAVASDGAVSIT